MAEPCCPDRAGQRGYPFSAHWFIVHDGTGAVDVMATWELGGLPRSDVELAGCLRGMFNERGRPLVCVTHASRRRDWYMWDGSGRYSLRKSTFISDLTWAAARWHYQALKDAWDAVLAFYNALPVAQQTGDRMKRMEKRWGAHRMYAAKLWSDAGQHAAASQLGEAFGQDFGNLNKGTGRIVVDNGVINVRQRVRDGYVLLEPHDEWSLVTKRCGEGVSWQPDAQCPRFEQFLYEVVPDADQRRWLLQRTAATLFGLMPRKGFLNLIGETHSGKSTFIKLIAAIAGDYAKSVPIETFLTKHSGDAGFRQHELMGMRFVHTQEPPEGARFDVSFMKTLTGRDELTTAGKYRDPVSWIPQCTPFIGSNGPIRFATSDDAMMEREEAIRFTRGYAVADPDIDVKLLAERDGVLRLLMDHATVWMPDKVPESLRTERESMAIQTEDALEFIADYIERGLIAETGPEWPAYKCVPRADLYGTYRMHWCEEAGAKPVTRKTFTEVIERKYPKGRSGKSRVFLGLAKTSMWSA